MLEKQILSKKKRNKRAGASANNCVRQDKHKSPSQASFGSPLSRRDPGLFHGPTWPVPTSPGPKLSSIWQPMKLGIAARFPAFSSRIKSTTHRVGRVSPCATRTRAARLLFFLARPPQSRGRRRSPKCSGLRRRLHPDRDGISSPTPPAPSRSRRAPPPQHPVDAAPSSQRQRAPPPQHPVSSHRLPIVCAISSFWLSQQ